MFMRRILYLNFQKIKIKYISLFFIILLLCSCKAIKNITDYSSWNANYQYSNSVLTHPVPLNQKEIYISISNTTREVGLREIEEQTKKAFLSKGFVVTDNPNAKYRLIANIRVYNKIPFSDFESIQSYWNMELNQGLLDDSIIRRRNISKIEDEVRKYTQHDIPNNTKITLDAKNQDSSNKTVSQIIESYKNFDISGVILGSGLGFLTNSAQNVIIGGIFGGFAFEMINKVTTPKSYLFVMDVEINEPRCHEFSSSINSIDSSVKTVKSCADINEIDKKIYQQDDYSYRRIEFSRKNEYIIYRTTLYSINTKIFASNTDLISRLNIDVPYILSSSIR